MPDVAVVPDAEDAGSAEQVDCLARCGCVAIAELGDDARLVWKWPLASRRATHFVKTVGKIVASFIERSIAATTPFR